MSAAIDCTTSDLMDSSKDFTVTTSRALHSETRVAVTVDPTGRAPPTIYLMAAATRSGSSGSRRREVWVMGEKSIWTEKDPPPDEVVGVVVVVVVCVVVVVVVVISTDWPAQTSNSARALEWDPTQTSPWGSFLHASFCPPV